MVLGEEIIGPGNEELSYEARFADSLEPGIYMLTGIFVDKERPISGSISLTVE